MLSALAEGKSVLRGLLLGEDVLATIGCFREMGVEIDVQRDRVIVTGVGLQGLRPPDKVLDCGNSGTTLRLMMGLLAAQPFTSRLTGDASLNRRPIERVAKPLREMGGQIEELRVSETERVVKITGRPLRGITYSLPVASAQVKSAILLAGLYAQGLTVVIEPIPSRDHSELMLQSKGAALLREGNKIEIAKTEKLDAQDLEIPGDISSAAFFLVAGAIGKGSEILLKGVGVNPTRTGILEVLEKMGAVLEVNGLGTPGGEAIADLKISSSPLRATMLAGTLIPRLIDEIPILAVAAAAAEGDTEIRDAAELRVKESDRIQAIERELTGLGAKVESFPDGMRIHGPTVFTCGTFHSGSDHRIAMSMAIAATLAPGPSLIQDVDCIATSYPDFFDQFRHLGAQIEVFSS